MKFACQFQGFLANFNLLNFSKLIKEIFCQKKRLLIINNIDPCLEQL